MAYRTFPRRPQRPFWTDDPERDADAYDQYLYDLEQYEDRFGDRDDPEFDFVEDEY